MKVIFILFVLNAFLYTQKVDPINQIKKVVVAPEFMAFQSNLEEDVWTVQTISRHFKVYDVKWNLAPHSIENTGDVDVLTYQTDTVGTLQFSKFITGYNPITIALEELPYYGMSRDLGVKDKISMIAFLNRNHFGFIDQFFQKEFRIGNKSLKTTLSKPINILYYKEDDRLIYQDDFKVYTVFTSEELSINKDDYDWEIKNRLVVITPKPEFIKQKPIQAIKSGRAWYNGKWSRLLNEGKMKAVLSADGMVWQTAHLSDKEKDLITWWKRD